jgi:hypothetical protein
MILADSSVWIDFLRDNQTWAVGHLKELLRGGNILMGDLILVEILQGYRSEREARLIESFLAPLETIEIASQAIAFHAARNYRTLRASGFTVRSTVDALIATRCISDGITLLHSDRDFLPFERELGLSVVKQVTH